LDLGSDGLCWVQIRADRVGSDQFNFLKEIG
jgi:hypothetical protein